MNSKLHCNFLQFCVIVFGFMLKKVCLFGWIAGKQTSMLMFIESNVILQKHPIEILEMK